MSSSRLRRITYLKINFKTYPSGEGLHLSAFHALKIRIAARPTDAVVAPSMAPHTSAPRIGMKEVELRAVALAASFSPATIEDLNSTAPPALASVVTVVTSTMSTTPWVSARLVTCPARLGCFGFSASAAQRLAAANACLARSRPKSQEKSSQVHSPFFSVTSYALRLS